MTNYLEPETEVNADGEYALEVKIVDNDKPVLETEILGFRDIKYRIRHMVEVTPKFPSLEGLKQGTYLLQKNEDNSYQYLDITNGTKLNIGMTIPNIDEMKKGTYLVQKKDNGESEYLEISDEILEKIKNENSNNKVKPIAVIKEQILETKNVDEITKMGNDDFVDKLYRISKDVLRKQRNRRIKRKLYAILKSPVTLVNKLLKFVRIFK